MPDIADAEAAFIEWLTPTVQPYGEISPRISTDATFTRIYRSGGLTDASTRLDHPTMVVSIFGSTPPVETSKAVVARTALDALARALDMKGQTVASTVVTDVNVVAGVQSLPEPNGRWHYQFTVQLTTHPSRT